MPFRVQTIICELTLLSTKFKLLLWRINELSQALLAAPVGGTSNIFEPAAIMVPSASLVVEVAVLVLGNSRKRRSGSGLAG